MTTTTDTPAVTTDAPTTPALGIVNRADFAACLHEINGRITDNNWGHLRRETEGQLKKIITFKRRAYDFLNGRYPHDDRFLLEDGQDDTIDLNKLLTWVGVLRDNGSDVGAVRGRTRVHHILRDAFINLGLPVKVYKDVYKVIWTVETTTERLVRDGWKGDLDGPQGVAAYTRYPNHDNAKIEMVPDPERATDVITAATADVKEAFALAIAKHGHPDPPGSLNY